MLKEINNKIRHTTKIKAETEKNTHALATMCFFSSPFIEAKTINCMIFIAIPENPCPVERDTIISKGK